jgi:hypothetical protein
MKKNVRLLQHQLKEAATDCNTAMEKLSGLYMNLPWPMLKVVKAAVEIQLGSVYRIIDFWARELEDEAKALEVE